MEKLPYYTHIESTSEEIFEWISRIITGTVKRSWFKKKWDDIQPEMDVIRAMIDARIEQNLTQKELASGLGMQLKIEFVPMQVSRK